MNWTLSGNEIHKVCSNCSRGESTSNEIRCSRSKFIEYPRTEEWKSFPQRLHSSFECSIKWLPSSQSTEDIKERDECTWFFAVSSVEVLATDTTSNPTIYCRRRQFLFLTIERAASNARVTSEGSISNMAGRPLFYSCRDLTFFLRAAQPKISRSTLSLLRWETARSRNLYQNTSGKIDRTRSIEPVSTF